MSKRSYKEIVSSDCAEVGKNVSEDLRNLRNNFLAGANDLCTDISATVAATASVIVQQCKTFATDMRVFGIGGSYATTSRVTL
jgi:hypothetical protein